MHATHILYNAAQPPTKEQSQQGDCRICGAHDVMGLPFLKWVPDTFTNHDQLRPGDIICGVCQFAFAQGSEFLAQRAGKDKPQKMQNYSHIVCGGVWHPLHKGQKAEILMLLRQSPELVAISTSGQKHVAFRARPGWWQVEEQSVKADLVALEACLDGIGKFYIIFSKDEIGTGNYSPGRMMQYVQAHGMTEFLATEAALKTRRGTAYFDLALYLAQKEEPVEQEASDGFERVSRTVSPGVTDVDPSVEGVGTILQAEVRTQHLGAVREQHQGVGVHKQSEQVLQRSLFETGDRADGG